MKDCVSLCVFFFIFSHLQHFFPATNCSGRLKLMISSVAEGTAPADGSPPSGVVHQVCRSRVERRRTSLSMLTYVAHASARNTR